jgi:5-methylthioadenosine/S-adenosylhomocysteine deaminase
VPITVIREGTVWTGGFKPETYPRADVVIHDGVITGIEPRYAGGCDTEIDAGGCIVVPGFINAHVHAGCTPHIRGMTEDASILEGGAYYHSLGSVLTLGFAKLSRDELAAIMEWDCIAMLAGGATTIVEENFGGHEVWIDLVERLGFRSDLGISYPNSVGAIGYIKDGKIVMDQSGDIGAMFEDGLRLHDAVHGKFDNRLHVHLSPHGPDTVPEEILRATRAECDQRGINANLHLAQHLNERKTIADKTGGKTSIEYLHDIGFLGPHVMGMHVTFIEDRDIPILAKTKTNVVHGSYRKAKEALVGPFWEYIAGGVNVAIATDSFSHDLIQDLRFAAMLGKIRQKDVGRPTADHVLACATAGAAKAMNRKDLGNLNPGARGDVAVIDISTPFNSPVYNPLRSLVYYSNARDIRWTLVDGEPVTKDGRVLASDVDTVGKRARQATQKLWDLAESEGLLPMDRYKIPSHTH